MTLDFLTLFFWKGNRGFYFFSLKAKVLRNFDCILTKVFMFLGHLPGVAQWHCDCRKDYDVNRVGVLILGPRFRSFKCFP